MDLFRYRCYLASLQGGELPNPKRLLAFASRPTKVAMGRLGIFSVSSFHALVSRSRGVFKKYLSWLLILSRTWRESLKCFSSLLLCILLVFWHVLPLQWVQIFIWICCEIYYLSLSWWALNCCQKRYEWYSLNRSLHVGFVDNSCRL